MDLKYDEEVSHEIITYNTDAGYQLECLCGWNYFAPKADQTKLHPDREPDCFAKATAERHYVEQGIWPYTKHGKPEKNTQGTIQIITDWPYNKE